MPQTLRLLAIFLLAAPCIGLGQSRLPSLPGTAEFTALRGKAGQSAKLTRGGGGHWLPDGRYTYPQSGRWGAVDPATGDISWTDQPIAPAPAVTRPTRPGGNVARGRQATRVTTEDGKTAAVYRDGNVFLVEASGIETAVTTDGDLAKRIKYGTGSWVYGEELGQREAMGFSPDGKWLWYYRFDEGQVQDFYTLLRQRTPQVVLATEAYPKPGTPNPQVEVYAYNVQTRQSTKIQVRPAAFDDGIGHYVHSVFWSPDSRELHFYRSNRLQNVREWCAANPATGTIRTVDVETYPNGWVEPGGLRNRVGDLYLIRSENSGWSNLAWVDPSAGKRTTITSHKFDVLTVVRVDEANRKIYYSAFSGPHPYRLQLHSVNFDGSGDRRLTDPDLNHSVEVSPNGKGFVDTADSSQVPPEVRILNSEGKVTAVIKKSDISEFQQAGHHARELVSFPSLDGTTTLYAHIAKPNGFDPSKKYPVIIQVYGGPQSPGGAPRDSWAISDDITNYGFLVVDIYGRGGGGRGQAFRQAVYKKLGIIEIDDQAAGAKYLTSLPYVDASKIGIEGTSYGGYASLMCLVRYPDLFAAACSSSIVSDWRNYDTTYTERYMGLLPDNAAAYDAGSTMTYAKNLKGELMIYYGTADDNTHPVNTMQMIAALQAAGKSFEVQVGPDAGHSGINNARMMEFFIERMVMKPTRTN